MSLQVTLILNIAGILLDDYGTTVVLTTHNVEIVNKLKRRVITLNHGRVTHDQSQGSYKQ